MLFLVTTTSRAGRNAPDPGYLSTVLSALRRELDYTAQPKGLRPRDMAPRPRFSWLRALVLNVHPHQYHPQFDRARARFGNDSFFAFNDSSRPIVDPWYGWIEEPDNLHNPKGFPGHEVRQQNCDLVAALLDAREFLRRHAPNPEEGRIVLVEDDSEPCAGMLAHLRFLLRFVPRSPPAAVPQCMAALTLWRARPLQRGVHPLRCHAQVAAAAHVLRHERGRAAHGLTGLLSPVPGPGNAPLSPGLGHPVAVVEAGE